MSNYKLKIITSFVAACFTLHAYAHMNVTSGKVDPVVAKTSKTLVADCPAAESQFDLAINNVRTRLLNGGDLWWDLTNAAYETPKIDPPGSAPSVHALFAGAIWISGLDEGGNLKLAAQTYRQGGDDFWPGPIDDQGNVTSETCEIFDKHFNVLGSEIDETRALFANNGNQPIGTSGIPENVLKWPGIGNPHLLADGIDITSPLAPFRDFNDDGRYDPTFGDYPVIDGNPKCGTDEFTYGDQMIFWVYNDVGNIHSETGGEAIGVQVNALAFAFQTSDEINDMTFYRYNIVNRSSATLTQTYMGQWVDPDLGCFNDDYVGCDTSRSLGIVYNGDNFDEDCQSLGYGNEVPLLGVDYFESPRDTGENAQEIGMSSFIYYNNDFTGQGNPSSAAQFRNYQTGFWRDGSLVECGGDAYQENTGPCPYMFPNDPSDAMGWSECIENTVAADRRFIQNSGPFILLPGAQNFITVGAVFVKQPPGFQSLCNADFDLLRSADDKAQALFDNCFKLVDGPDAPTLEIRELDKELIITLINEQTSNNQAESYNQVDPLILIEEPTAEDTTYTFQGYLVYQLENQSVSTQELTDPTKAKLVFQSDIKDEVGRIINFEFDQVSQAEIPDVKVEGENLGVRHSFRLTEDAFASDNPVLVNHRTYYFAALAYAHNNYKDFDPQNPMDGGQKRPYLQGRRNFSVYSAIPHIPDARNMGTRLNAEYGQGLEVTRVEGEGNGGLELRISETSENSILNNPDNRSDSIIYEPGFAPIDVKVVDPFILKEANFELRFIENDTSAAGSLLSNNATWELRDLTNNRTILSDRTIERTNEQIIIWDDPDSDIDVEYGISVSVGQPVPIYTNARNGEPVYEDIGGSILFADQTQQWLSFIQDVDGNTFENWIRSGELFVDEGIFAFVFNDFSDELTPLPPDMTMFHDPDEVFEDIVSASFAPYCLAANWTDEITAGQFFPFTHGPGFKWERYNLNKNSQNTLDELQSILLVITNDKSKWTRSLVIETGENYRLNDKFTRNGQVKPNFSVDKEGVPSSPVSFTDIEPGEAYLAIGQDGFQLSYTDSSGGTTIVRDNLSSANYDGHAGFLASDINASTALTVDNGVVVYNARDIGASWFPGYAINLENGERLNISFGESSMLPDQNGTDMIWNPTENLRTPVNSVLNGGKHHIYVMKTLYDEGEAHQKTMVSNYNAFLDVSTFEYPTEMKTLYRDFLYTSMPYLTPGFSLNSVADGIAFDEVKIYINVSKPYEKYGTVNTATDSLPRYLFNTQGLAPEEGVAEVADSALDLINVVPNPYYAFSTYETSQLDNRIKITNLPNECTVTIFSIDGKLIRQYRRAVDSNIDISTGNTTEFVNLDNSIDWDLKNSVGIPIASGLYLIHVDAPDIGERTIKWFGALRPTDLDSF